MKRCLHKCIPAIPNAGDNMRNTSQSIKFAIHVEVENKYIDLWERKGKN